MRGRRSCQPTLPRREPRQERSAATIDAILGAVEKILDRDGMAAVTTNRIAEIAGVSIGSVYQYYPNKEALIGALTARYLDQTMKLCRETLAIADGVPIRTLVEWVVRALVHAGRTQRAIHRDLTDLRSAVGFQEPYRRAFDALVEDVAAFLGRRTDVRFPDTQAAAFVLVHGAEGIASAAIERRRDAPIDIGAIAHAGIELLTAYLMSARIDSTCDVTACEPETAGGVDFAVGTRG